MKAGKLEFTALYAAGWRMSLLGMSVGLSLFPTAQLVSAFPRGLDGFSLLLVACLV